MSRSLDDTLPYLCLSALSFAQVRRIFRDWIVALHSDRACPKEGLLRRIGWIELNP